MIVVDLAILLGLFYWLRSARQQKDNASGADGIPPSSDFMNPEAPPIPPSGLVTKPLPKNIMFGGERPASGWDGQSFTQHDVSIRFADVPDSYVAVAGGRLYANMKIPGPKCAFRLEQVKGMGEAVVSIRAIGARGTDDKYVGVEQSGSLILGYAATHQFLLGKSGGGASADTETEIEQDEPLLWTLRSVTLKALVERSAQEPFHLRVGGDRVGKSTVIVLEPYVDARIPDTEMVRDLDVEEVHVMIPTPTTTGGM